MAKAGGALYGRHARGQTPMFVDETGTPRNGGANTTVLASVTVEGIGSSMAVEGHVEYFLAPTLVEGQAVVMDNLSAHNGDKFKELI